MRGARGIPHPGTRLIAGSGVLICAERSSAAGPTRAPRRRRARCAHSRLDPEGRKSTAWVGLADPRKGALLRGRRPNVAGDPFGRAKHRLPAAATALEPPVQRHSQRRAGAERRREVAGTTVPALDVAEMPATGEARKRAQLKTHDAPPVAPRSPLIREALVDFRSGPIRGRLPHRRCAAKPCALWRSRSRRMPALSEHPVLVGLPGRPGPAAARRAAGWLAALGRREQPSGASARLSRERDGEDGGGRGAAEFAFPEHRVPPRSLHARAAVLCYERYERRVAGNALSRDRRRRTGGGARRVAAPGGAPFWRSPLDIGAWIDPISGSIQAPRAGREA